MKMIGDVSRWVWCRVCCVVSGEYIMMRERRRGGGGDIYK